MTTTQLVYFLFTIGFGMIIGVAYKTGYRQCEEDMEGNLKHELPMKPNPQVLTVSNNLDWELKTKEIK